tara:strand:- start:32 stop:667 length:636 start_codon:yes stop_codon:yes gene_type:complete
MANYTNIETRNIYNSRKILTTILERRGYDVNGYDNFNVNEIQTMLDNDQLDMLLVKNKDTEGESKIFVKYHLTKLSQTNIYDIIDDLFNVEEILNKNDELLILIKDKPNVKIEKLINIIYQKDNIYFNVSSINEYMFNILDHNLVPPHRPMSSVEKEEIKKIFNVRFDSEFPEISRFDPVAKVIGLRPNSLCEIIRPSETSIQSKYYRLCI